MDSIKSPAGVTLKPLEIGLAEKKPYRDGYDRHGRMFRNQEFDACEQSLASYVIARSRGDTRLIGAPVFPRRLFSQSCMLVNADALIKHPTDLAGKKVAVNSLQTTLTVQAKGDLCSEYGVNLNDIDWFVQRAEELPLDTETQGSAKVIPASKRVEEMLIAGELDAYIHPSPPPMLLNHKRVRRLFENTRTEGGRYFRKYGYCPIMHLFVFPTTTVDREPWLPAAVMAMWEESKQQALAYYDDPGYGLMLFSREALEEQRLLLGSDPWTSGLTANRENLQRFIDYMVTQKLIEKSMPVATLFHESVQLT